MADNHLFTAYIELRDDLSQVEFDALDYLFNGRQTPPLAWPEHAWFEDGKVAQVSGPEFFPDAPPGAFVAAAWRLEEGMFSGVHFTCPNLRSEWFGNDGLWMLQWLATLSRSRGYVGALKNQDDKDGLPLTLYIYDGKLYLHDVRRGVELLAVDDGAPHRWE